jgi:hypothetical protein
MTTAQRADDPDTAIVDGVDVDALATAVRACPGVSDLAGGRFGDATSYLPGRRLTGVAVRGDTVRISVRAKWGVSASDLLEQITSALAPALRSRRIEVVIAEIDDPPSLTAQQPVAVPAGPIAFVLAGSDTSPSAAHDAVPAGTDTSVLTGSDVPAPAGHDATSSNDPPTASRAPAQLPPLLEPDMGM